MDQRNYRKTISNIRGVLKLWQMRNLSIGVEIVAFKTLAIFKLVYIAIFTVISNHFYNEIAKIQQTFK